MSVLLIEDHIYLYPLKVYSDDPESDYYWYSYYVTIEGFDWGLELEVEEIPSRWSAQPVYRIKIEDHWVYACNFNRLIKKLKFVYNKYIEEFFQ